MDTTTADGSVQSTDSAAPWSAPDAAEAFQNLIDQGLTDAPEGTSTEQTPDSHATDDPEGDWSAEKADEEKKPVEAEAKDVKETSKDEKEPEGKTYESLDKFLEEQKLDRESFLSLPVAVKVDGTEQSLPLSEVLKGYQLSAASYNRLNELAQQKTQFQTEQEQVRKALGERINQTEALFKLANEQLLADYQAINWQQLQAENPGQAALLYQQFQARQGAIDQHLKSIAANRQQEAQASDQKRQQVLRAEHAKMLDAIPELRDPTKAPVVMKTIRDYATSRKFSEAELNAIFDHRYMAVLHDAAQFRALQAAAPKTVNRVRAAPRMTPAGTRTNADPRRSAIQQAEEVWAKSGGRDDDAGAAIFSQF